MAFICFPVLPQKDMTVGEFEAWLRQFDSNHDGRISKEELQRALHSLHTWFPWWKARRGIKEVDVNRNGMVDKEEIGKLVNYAQQHLHMKICDYDSY
ncbi:polcalcin Phl p 7 [Cocos nucifera]|uniref:Polcalcin Phl p 7 n=1 Tax=Cocos nucifera TaxID=13894 RepID=A0A8K0NAS6_COCNU|nr:polcalcin Phl p 7 [Cocos nucifera]